MDFIENLHDEHSQCIHPYFINNKCTSCEKSITNCSNPTTIKFTYIHSNLTLSLPEINRVRQDNLQPLFERKKLNLVLDLDHTLVHAISIDQLKPNEEKIIERMDDVFKITNPYGDYVVKLRPGVRDFLNLLSSMFDFSVHTLGSREYADKVVEVFGGLARFLWVITREDCLKDMQKSFDNILSYKDVSLIVDDTRHVWDESCQGNLIEIYRYKFFPIENKANDVDKEFDRVFHILWEVHSAFYRDDCDYGEKNVEEILKLVLM